MDIVATNYFNSNLVIKDVSVAPSKNSSSQKTIQGGSTITYAYQNMNNPAYVNLLRAEGRLPPSNTSGMPKQPVTVSKPTTNPNADIPGYNLNQPANSAANKQAISASTAKPPDPSVIRDPVSYQALSSTSTPTAQPVSTPTKTPETLNQAINKVFATPDLSSVNVLDSSGKVLGTVTTDNPDAARLRIMELITNAGDQGSLQYTTEIKPPPLTGSTVVLSSATLQKSDEWRAKLGLQPLENTVPIALSSGTQSLSINPDLENAILTSFKSSPTALLNIGGSKGSYIIGLYQKGVLTSNDLNTINGLVSNYNQGIQYQNQQIQKQNIQSADKEISNITNTLQQAKNSGVSSVNIVNGQGKIIGSVNPQNISQARLQTLQLLQKAGDSGQLQYNLPQKQSQQEQVFSKTTYYPKNILTALTAGILGSSAEIGLTVLGALEKIVQNPSLLLKPVTGSELQGLMNINNQATLQTEKAIGQDPTTSIISGQKVDYTDPLVIAGFAGFGVSILATGGLGTIKSAITGVIEAVQFTKIMSKVFPTLTKTISVVDEIASTSSKLESLSSKTINVKTEIEKVLKTSFSEKILQTSTETPLSLTNKVKPLSSALSILEAQAKATQDYKTALENLQKVSPNEILRTETVQSIAKLKPTTITGKISYLLSLNKGLTKLGPKTGIVFGNDMGNSPFSGALITLGKKGAYTVTELLKNIPEETRAVPSPEIMSGVRGIIRKGLSKYGSLTGQQQLTKIGGDVAKFLKTQPSSYEVTYPKNIEGLATPLITLDKLSEKVDYIASILVPKPTVYAVGKELSSSAIKSLLSKNPTALTQTLIGEEVITEENIDKIGQTGLITDEMGDRPLFGKVTEKVIKKTSALDLIEGIKTGDISFIKSNIENVVTDINKLKAPIIIRDFASGLGELVAEREKGFNYLASRFSKSFTNKLVSNKKSMKFNLLHDEKIKSGAGSSGKAAAYGRSIQEAKNGKIIQQIMKEKDLSKPLTQEEKDAIIKVLKENNKDTETAKPSLKYKNTTELLTGSTPIQDTETIYRTTHKDITDEALITLTKLKITPSLREIIPTLKTNTKEKYGGMVILRKPGNSPITTDILITHTGTSTISKQINKQTQKQQQLIQSITINKPPPTNTPKPGKKQEDIPILLSSSKKKPVTKQKVKGKERINFIGNASEASVVGLYNRSETLYGSKKVSKLLSFDIKKEAKAPGVFYKRIHTTVIRKIPKDNTRKESRNSNVLKQTKISLFGNTKNKKIRI